MRATAIIGLLAALGCEKPDCRDTMISAGYPPGCITRHSASVCSYDSAGCGAVSGLTGEGGAPAPAPVLDGCVTAGDGPWPHTVKGSVSGVAFVLSVEPGAVSLTTGADTESTEAFTVGPGTLKAGFDGGTLHARLEGGALSASLSVDGVALFSVEGLACQ